MDNYDDYDEYSIYDSYNEEIGEYLTDIIERGFNIKDVTELLISLGIITDETIEYHGTMEKLIFLEGNEKEVYSSEEINFIECVDEVIVFQSFKKTINSSESMICRPIAVKCNAIGPETIFECVYFQRVFNKAFDGFNMFFFFTGESLLFGCKILTRGYKYDCILSEPIKTEEHFGEIQEALITCTDNDSFIRYYSEFISAVFLIQSEPHDYERSKQRFYREKTNYINSLFEIGRQLQIDVSEEVNRYNSSLDTEEEKTFDELFMEAIDSSSFIKSNRVNTLELLFDAEDALLFSEESVKQINEELNNGENNLKNADEEIEKLINENVDDAIKLLMKRKGL